MFYRSILQNNQSNFLYTPFYLSLLSHSSILHAALRQLLQFDQTNATACRPSSRWYAHCNAF